MWMINKKMFTERNNKIKRQAIVKNRGVGGIKTGLKFVNPYFDISLEH